MGGEAEKVGSFCTLLQHILELLQEKLDEQKEHNISLSFSMFGVSDTSCIDLATYERKLLVDMQKLEDWSPLGVVDSTKPIIDSLQQGYSLPCVLLVRLFVRPSDATLPGAMSTLVLADLGYTSNGSQLEKSLAQLCNLVFASD